MEIERTRLKDNIAIEESQHVKLTIGQVKYFLLQLRRGNINDTKYRRLLINTLIYKVYIYDNSIAVYFNTQDKPIEKKIPRIEIAESSFLGKDALPYEIHDLILSRVKSFFYKIKILSHKNRTYYFYNLIFHYFIINHFMMIYYFMTIIFYNTNNNMYFLKQIFFIYSIVIKSFNYYFCCHNLFIMKYLSNIFI